MKNILYSFLLFLILLAFQAMSEDAGNGPGSGGNSRGSVMATQEAGAKTDEVWADPQKKFGPYEVAKVVDGDTIDVTIEGQKNRVRLIGINTPESVDPRKPVECFGKEASDKTREILTGKKVLLEADASQTDRDKYDRLLRYVFLEDGTNFNELMVREGYAYEYTYDLPYKYQKDFKAAQKEASDAGKGLWGEGACGISEKL